jgi:hypothetical protein
VPATASTKTAKPKPSFIDPNRLYSLAGFLQCSGFTPQRMGELRRLGIDLPRLKCGRRVFIEGSAAIEYIRRASQL